MINAEVKTTQNRGFTPEELAEMCADRIITISDSAAPEIKQQAVAFRGDLVQVLKTYLQQAVSSDRTTVYNALTDAGQPKLADLIRRL